MKYDVGSRAQSEVRTILQIAARKFPSPPPPHFSNGPSLSNDDGDGNENVPSYLNECMFDFNSLKMANIGELPYGILGTAPKFGLRDEI